MELGREDGLDVFRIGGRDDGGVKDAMNAVGVATQGYVTAADDVFEEVNTWDG